MNAAQMWCLPVVKRMTDILLAEDIIHADETHVQVLHGETTTSQMWVYCNGKINGYSQILVGSGYPENHCKPTATLDRT